MSAEITYSHNLNVSKDPLNSRRSFRKSIDMSGTDLSDVVQSIPTTAGGTAITIAAAVATLGIAMVTNLDPTNYVTLGLVVSATYYPFMKLKPGEEWPVRLTPGVSYYALANTSAVKIRTAVFED